MAQKDLFADLLGSFSSGSKNDLNKMTLAERQRHQQSVNQKTANQLNDSWSGLDLLGSATPSVQKLQATPVVDEFDLFANGSSSTVNTTKAPVESNQQSTTNSQTASSIDQLDDFFGVGGNANGSYVSTKSNSNGNGNINASTSKVDNLFTDDEFTDAFTEEEPQQSTSETPEIFTTNTVPAPVESEMYKRDRALSELLDMGFELKVAKRALNETTNYDINEAISIIMSEAHRKSKMQRNSAPANQERQRTDPELDELTQALQDLTVDIKSKAFSLFSKGRETLAKGLEMYKEQQYANSDNQPVWMRNQQTYKLKSTAFDEDEDDFEELDRDRMRMIVEKQRALDKKMRLEKMRLEKERRAKLERQNSLSSRGGSKFDEPISRPKAKFEEPVRRSRNTFDEPVRNNSASQVPRNDPPDSRFNEPVSRRSTTNEQKKTEAAVAPKPKPAPQPAPQTTQPVEDLFDIFNAPLNSGKKALIPDVYISSILLDSFKNSRERGNNFFKKGDFTNALLQYQDSLSTLPPNHKLSIISLSNISNAQSKLGNSRECLNTIDQALSLIDTYHLEINQFNDVEIESDKMLKPIWIKLISRKAESLEHLEKFQDSLTYYNMCITNGGASKSVMDGKRRVMKILQPAPKKTTPKPSPQVPQAPSLRQNESLKKIAQQNSEKEKEDLTRFALHDSIELRVAHWKTGKEDNLRALLASLHEILWEELGWKPVSMTDLVLNKKVKIYYLKAVAKTHPDKLNNCTVEQKMIAQNVFVVLNQSWDKFKESNGMN